MSRRTRLATATALVLVVVLTTVEPSLAKTSDIGQNVGDEVMSWAKGLLLGSAALVGLPALFRRDIGQGLVIVLIVILVGGFVYAPGAVDSTIKTMWQTFSGTNGSEEKPAADEKSKDKDKE